MSHFVPSFSLLTPVDSPSTKWLAALIVTFFHVLFLGWSAWFSSSQTPLPLRSKVLVQTIQLAPPQQPMTTSFTAPPQLLALSEPLTEIVETPVVEAPVPVVVEEVPTPILPKEEPLPLALLPKQEDVEIPLPPPVEPPKPKPPVKPTPKPPKKPEPKPTPPPLPVHKPTPLPKPQTPAPKKPTAPIKKPVDNAKKAAEKKQKEQRAAQEAERQQQQLEEKRQKEEENQRRQGLLTKAQESLAKMSDSHDKISLPTSVSLSNTLLPQQVSSLQIDALPFDVGAENGTWSAKEVSYQEEVVQRLERALKFPEYGFVQIKLTLDRMGKVVKVEIMESKSAKNTSYIERTLPKQSFPPFGQRFEGTAHYTFLISLYNDAQKS